MRIVVYIIVRDSLMEEEVAIEGYPADGNRVLCR